MSFSSLSDALVAGGCIRPTTLLAGLRHGNVSAKAFARRSAADDQRFSGGTLRLAAIPVVSSQDSGMPLP